MEDSSSAASWEQGVPIPHPPPLPTSSPINPSTIARRRIAAANGSAPASPARTPTRHGVAARRLSSSGTPSSGSARTPLSERRRRAEEERIKNLKGLPWFMHHLGQHRAVVTLVVWLSNMWAFMTGYGHFKPLRWVDAPFIVWLQRPKNVAHQFVTHGFGQAWAPMLLVEMAYAWAYSCKQLLLTRGLLIPLGAFYWVVFGRIAHAEQRLRLNKGKLISWEEYLCIYLPFAVKAGFFAASACINTTGMVAVDYLGPVWLQLTVAWTTQVILFCLGIYAIRFHDCNVTLAYVLWGLHGQPRPLPRFTSLPASLLVMGRVLKFCRNWVRRTAGSLPSHAPPGKLSQSDVIKAVSPRVYDATKELDERLTGLEAQIASGLARLITNVHFLQIHAYTNYLPSLPFTPAKLSTSSSSSSSSSSAAPSMTFFFTPSSKTLKRTKQPPQQQPTKLEGGQGQEEKKEAEQEGEETAAITAPAATGAGEHLSANPLEATDAKQGGKEEEMELSAAGRGGKAKDASKSAGLGRRLLASLATPLLLALALLLRASYMALLAPLSNKATLSYGEELHVGEALKYRCSLAERLHTDCMDLDLVLHDDGALSLYRDRQRTAAALLWQSPSLPSALSRDVTAEEAEAAEGQKAFVARVGERARLIVSVGEEVVYQSPRLVANGNHNNVEEQEQEQRPMLALNGVMGGFYIQEQAGVPTFSSLW